MSRLLERMGRTRASKPVGSIRILLGSLFLSAGLTKILVPALREAFSGQLAQAELPAPALNLWLVPLLEITLGGLLVLGLFSRLAALVALPIMLVATYVHLVVDDPALFPLQPEPPLVPLIVSVLCGVVLGAGGGAWSVDLHEQEITRGRPF